MQMKSFGKIRVGLAAIVLVLLSCDGGLCQFRRGQGRAGQGVPGARGQLGPRPGNPLRIGGNRRQQLQQELVRRLGVTPDQQVKLRGIAREFNEPLIVAGRDARQRRRALDDAMLSDQYDEARIKHLADEWAVAQANLMKLQALRQAALRRVLTPEQMLQMNEMQKELRRQQRQQRNAGDEPTRPPG